MRAANHASGFTLIEAIVALAIFAILVALGVPAMRLWVSNVKCRAIADALQNGVRLAQAESLRRSRQVVFSLTNSPSPNISLTAAINGSYWSINTIPAMTDGSEPAAFVESGVLGFTASSNAVVTGPAEICFNSAGRLVANAATGVPGGSCTLPNTTPPVWVYNVSLAGADHPMQVEVYLGGRVHMCDPSQTYSSTNPYGC
jgi:type IV fimbrial biogenesis protein FimT